MKNRIGILIILTFSVSFPLFGNEKGKQVLSAETKDAAIDLYSFNRLEILSLSQEQLDALPVAIKRRIPDHLTKTDSLLINTDFQSAFANDNKINAFHNGDFSGNILKTGKNAYQILDNQNRLLGVFYKSKDGKQYTLLNIKGKLLYNSQGLLGLLIAIIILAALLSSLLILGLIYLILSGG